jgi:NAD(P)-dependent dehydrogenase (short-subunit alcohol dehydrogenase family)
LAIVVPFRESCSAKTTFAKSHDGRPLSYEAGRLIHHALGHDLLTGSIASVKGFSDYSIYSATKAAVRSFARTWTTDLKGRGIRVNVVSPGPIDTPLLHASLPQDKLEALSATITMGRLGRPEEIASAVVFLASSDASFITGAELFVDGGSAQV